MIDKNTISPFNNSFSEEIWRTTYKDYRDTTIQDTFQRVAKSIASAEKTPELQEKWEGIFLEMLQDFKVVPGGRILANAGTDWKSTTLFNCYVSPMPTKNIDSIDGIYSLLKSQAKTLASEGGYGTNLSHLRPRGAFIKGIGVDSPGAIKFAELFDKSSEIVTAGSGKSNSSSTGKGKIRKGAQMFVLNCDSEDIFEFITAKQTPGRLTKFNMSVNFTKPFMDKVLKIEELTNSGASEEEILKYDSWDLVFPDTTHPAYGEEWDGNNRTWISKGYPMITYSSTSIRKIWELVMSSTFSRNEPGVLFLDRANELNPARAVENIIASNPCGEIPLPSSGICCLSTLNLTQFIKKSGVGFDLDRVSKYIKFTVRFLDNVNSVSDAPLEEYRWSKEHKRRIGCGIMGWGSSLFMMKVKLGSEQASAIREELMSVVARSAYEASIDLAVEKGMYSVCNKEDLASIPFLKVIGLSTEYLDKLKAHGIRNSAVLSAQPNGNSSILANIISGGIEPIFMPEYVRTSIEPSIPSHLVDVTPDFIKGVYEETDFFKWVKEGDEDILRGTDAFGVVYKIDKNRGLTKETLCEDYSVKYLKSIGEWDPKAEWAVTTTELSAYDHVNDLQGFCKYLDNSASKTVNLPENYSYEDFKKLYLFAYNTGTIKGLTTYRAGTSASVLSAVKETIDVEEEIILEEIKLPDSLPATLKTIRSEGRKWYLTVILNEAQTKPVALFTHTNNHEKSVTTNDAVDHLVALATTKGIPQKHIDETLAKASGDTNTTRICRVISLCLRHGVLIRNLVSAMDKVDCIAGSFVFHIRKYLASFIKDGEKVKDAVCEECGSANIVYQEGCRSCKNCSSSKCS